MNRTILTVMCLAFLAGCSLSSLNPFAGRSANEAIADAFDTDDADRRREGILALSRRSGGMKEPYLKAYAVLAEDPDPLVRSTAIGTLGRAGDPTYLGVILDALTDDDLGVRIDAADALDNTHGDSAVKPLRRHAATDPAHAIRARCVRALRNYRSEEVLDTLMLALDDRAYGVRYAARQTLQEMTGRDAAYDRAQWRRMLAATDDPFAHPEPARSWWRMW